jgi:hypothetical protein
MRRGAKSFPAGHSGANGYLENLTSMDARPAKIFCSRELERGLMEFVESHVASTGRMPSDAMMQARGRQVLNADITAAEDPDLMARFKDMMSQKVPQAGPAENDTGDTVSSAMPSNMDITISDEDMNNFLQDMNFEFDAQDMGGVSLLGMEGVQEGGGVSLNMDGFNN